MFAQLVPIVVWVVTAGLVFVLYRRSRLVRPAPVTRTGEASASSADAVDYYWRPG